jgi:monovalent cation/proton antiporter MnhG/PhaG subunit
MAGQGAGITLGPRPAAGDARVQTMKATGIPAGQRSRGARRPACSDARVLAAGATVFAFWLVISASLAPADLLLGAVLSAAAGLWSVRFLWAGEAPGVAAPAARAAALPAGLQRPGVPRGGARRPRGRRSAPADQPRLITCRTGLRREISRVAFAHSVSLTPGTLTVDMDGGTFLVHCLDEESPRASSAASSSGRSRACSNRGATGVNAFFWGLATFLLVNAFACLWRAFVGPTVVDRILATNVVCTKALLVLVLLGLAFGRGLLLDVALVYGLLNFGITIAATRFLETGRLKGRLAAMTGMLVHALTIALACAGGLFFLAGTLGLLRLPDFYSRVHAVTKCDTVGAGAILLALALHVAPHPEALKISPCCAGAAVEPDLGTCAGARGAPHRARALAPARGA